MQHCPSGKYLRGSFARRRDCKLNWFLQNYSLVPAAAAIASALTAFKEYSLEGCGWSPRETSCLILQKHWIELILSQRLREQIDLASLLCDAEWWAAWFTEGPKIWDQSTLDSVNCYCWFRSTSVFWIINCVMKLMEMGWFSGCRGLFPRDHTAGTKPGSHRSVIWRC